MLEILFFYCGNIASLFTTPNERNKNRSSEVPKPVTPLSYLYPLFDECY